MEFYYPKGLLRPKPGPTTMCYLATVSVNVYEMPCIKAKFFIIFSLWGSSVPQEMFLFHLHEYNKNSELFFLLLFTGLKDLKQNMRINTTSIIQSTTTFCLDNVTVLCGWCQRSLWMTSTFLWMTSTHWGACLLSSLIQLIIRSQNSNLFYYLLLFNISVAF